MFDKYEDLLRLLRVRGFEYNNRRLGVHLAPDDD